MTPFTPLRRLKLDGVTEIALPASAKDEDSSGDAGVGPETVCEGLDVRRPTAGPQPILRRGR